MTKKEKIEKCFSKIDDFCIENEFSEDIKKLLYKFMSNYLQIRRVPTDTEMEFKLNSLLDSSDYKSTKNIDMVTKVIKKTLEYGWASFYPLKSNNTVRMHYNQVTTTTQNCAKENITLDLSEENF